jgi:cell pole-organizing protein PopZ
MANDDSNKGPAPTPRDGRTDDDIFAEMGRMLAQDQVGGPALPKATPPSNLPDAPPPSRASASTTQPAPQAENTGGAAAHTPAQPPTGNALGSMSPRATIGEDPPLELTQVIAPGRTAGPVRQKPLAPTAPSSPPSKAEAVPAPDPAPAGPAATAPVDPAATAPSPAAPPATPPAPTAAAPRQEVTVAAAAAMLAASQAKTTPASDTAATVSNRSLDAVVQDVMRPIVQEWLDNNLERIVREEAAKAVASAPKP